MEINCLFIMKYNQVLIYNFWEKGDIFYIALFQHYLPGLSIEIYYEHYIVLCSIQEPSAVTKPRIEPMELRGPNYRIYVD